MSNLVPPHGADSLNPLLLPETERAEEAQRAGHLKRVPMSSREVSDLFMLGMGAYTPLDGFMGEADWRGCSENMTLASGLFWPIPITLSCAQELGDSIGIGEDVALVEGDSDEMLGILTVEEKVRDRPRIRVFARVPHDGSGASRRRQGAEPGSREPRRSRAHAVGRPFSGDLRRALSSSRRDPGDVLGARLVEGRCFPDAQPDAPQP